MRERISFRDGRNRSTGLICVIRIRGSSNTGMRSQE
jgi:hypothetical protein